MLGRMPWLHGDAWLSLLSTKLNFLSSLLLLQQLPGGPWSPHLLSTPEESGDHADNLALRLPSDRTVADPDPASARGRSSHQGTDARRGC